MSDTAGAIPEASTFSKLDTDSLGKENAESYTKNCIESASDINELKDQLDILSKTSFSVPMVNKIQTMISNGDSLASIKAISK